MIGDIPDIVGRLQSGLPIGWFPNDLAVAPVLRAILYGLAESQAFIYTDIAYDRTQSRIATATDGNLDLVASDFFGLNLRRVNGQSDTSFRAVIDANLFRERVTRHGVDSILFDLTGSHPQIIEGQNPTDLGGYNTGYLGYGAGGYYGSGVPYTAFVVANRPEPPQGSSPSVNGYGDSFGGYGIGSSAYADPAITPIPDSALYAAVASVKPIATLVWMKLTSDPPPFDGPILLLQDTQVLRPT